jgi:hypothetical protein
MSSQDLLRVIASRELSVTVIHVVVVRAAAGGTSNLQPQRALDANDRPELSALVTRRARQTDKRPRHGDGLHNVPEGRTVPSAYKLKLRV